MRSKGTGRCKDAKELLPPTRKYRSWRASLCCGLMRKAYRGEEEGEQESFTGRKECWKGEERNGTRLTSSKRIPGAINPQEESVWMIHRCDGIKPDRGRAIGNGPDIHERCPAADS
jgi:hypothetical protein